MVYWDFLICLHNLNGYLNQSWTHKDPNWITKIRTEYKPKFINTKIGFKSFISKTQSPNRSEPNPNKDPNVCLSLHKVIDVDIMALCIFFMKRFDSLTCLVPWWWSMHVLSIWKWNAWPLRSSVSRSALPTELLLFFCLKLFFSKFEFHSRLALLWWICMWLIV